VRALEALDCSPVRVSPLWRETAFERAPKTKSALQNPQFR
jgi:hypothetical protein